MLRIVARQRVAPGRVYWIVGLVTHRGHPYLDSSEHHFATRREAVEYGEAMYRNCEPGSLGAEFIAKHGGLEPA